MDRTISKQARDRPARGRMTPDDGPLTFEIVHEGAAQRLGDACDGMGALLRFRLHG